MSISRILIAVGFLTFILSVPVNAGPQYLRNGLALGGYDAVAYFTEDSAVLGSSEYTYRWNNAEWHFVRAENRDLFAENPTKYAPVYDGHCAYGVAKNVKVPGDPEQWTIYNDRLYVNINRWIRYRWEWDIPGNLSQSEDNWVSLESQSASTR